MTAGGRRRVAFGLGANLGDRLAALQGAVDLLCAAGPTPVAVSPVYQTAPVGGPDQPDYLNAVLVVETDQAPRDLLALAQRVEQAFRRTREVRWGPRTLDVDVLAIGADVVDEPDLQVPHPRAAERAFVLVPWAAADPEAELPGRGPITALLSTLDVAGVVARPDLVLVLPPGAP